jgi:hypothetical protein
MTKPQGFYVAYLERLAKEREARGEAPAPDVHDQKYWDDRAKWHQEQQNARRRD